MTKMSLLNATAVALALSLSTPAIAADEYNVSNGLTLTGNALGLHGTDPTSMFKDGMPMIGDATYTAAYDGVDYYFATEAAMKKFETNPAGYLPQFGGFCAFGVFVGKKLDGDVRYADLVDGKLYLFVNAAIFAKYLENKDEVINGAHTKWPDITHTPISDL